MNNDLSSKQAFLRENVLEMGYDADEFMSFLQMKKGENGLDLNNWNMEELINVVNDFIKSKKNIPTSDEDTQDIKEEENNINNINNNMQNIDDKNDNLNAENNINTKESDLLITNNTYSYANDIGKCQASEMTSFSGVDKITVKLSSPKKIERKMFSKAFISYVVTTDPFNFETNKRYSDFAMLRKILSLIYTNCVVPPLCKKNFSDRFSDYLIEKRMRSIEKFMNGILEHPLMKNSEVVKDFLSLSNTREYNNKMDKYNKIKKSPSVVRQIKTINGEVNIGINEAKETYFDNIKNYVKGNIQLLQKITKGYKSLMNIMQQLSNKMIDISKLWKQVLDKSLKYYDSHNTSETFNIMSKLMENWAEVQKSQIKVINVNIREYFRYVKNEFNGLKEMSEKVQSCQNTYTKFNEKLLKTKEALYEKKDPETWQLKPEDKKNMLDLMNNKDLAFSKMLPQDTLKLYEYKHFYGCMLNSLIVEFERIRRVNAKRHKENTTKFVRELSSELTNLHVYLADRLSEFYELRDDKDAFYKNGEVLINKVESGQEGLDEENNNNNKLDSDNIDINNNEENNSDIFENNSSKDIEKMDKNDDGEDNKKNNENNINNINIEDKKDSNENNVITNSTKKKSKENIEEKKENNIIEIKNEINDKKENNIEIKKEEKKGEEKLDDKDHDKKRKEEKVQNNNIIEIKNEKKDENNAEININNINNNKEEKIKNKEEKKEDKKEEKKEDKKDEKKEDKKEEKKEDK